MALSPFNLGFSRAQILPSPTPSVEDHLALGESLGEGHFGVVRGCTDKRTGERLACKSIHKSKLKCWTDRQDVRREVEIMGLLGEHPNIVALRAAFEDASHVHLAMDCCEGGELFDEINYRGPLTEAHAAQAVHGVAQALVHCHRMGVLHRDLKPENILLVWKAEKRRRLAVKLADFGLSVRVQQGEVISGIAGSRYYLAPEVLVGAYGHKADVWSLGVVLYMMLSGVPPFDGASDNEILDRIMRAELKFLDAIWERVSDEARDLVRRMLQRDLRLRPTAQEVLDHPWVLKHTCEAVELSPHTHSILRSSSLKSALRSELLASTASDSGAVESLTCSQFRSSSDGVPGPVGPRMGSVGHAAHPGAPEVEPLGTCGIGVHECRSLPRGNSKALELLTWLSPQVAGATVEHSSFRRRRLDSRPGPQSAIRALEESPFLHQFNEVMSELEDGIHYFVLEEAAGGDNSTHDLRLQLAEIEEADSKPSSLQADLHGLKGSGYEPTPVDAWLWIFGF